MAVTRREFQLDRLAGALRNAFPGERVEVRYEMARDVIGVTVGMDVLAFDMLKVHHAGSDNDMESQFIGEVAMAFARRSGGRMAQLDLAVDLKKLAREQREAFVSQVMIQPGSVIPALNREWLEQSYGYDQKSLALAAERHAAKEMLAYDKRVTLNKAYTVAGSVVVGQAPETNLAWLDRRVNEMRVRLN